MLLRPASHRTRWLLPWMVLALAEATLANALNTAAADWLSAQEESHHARIEVATGTAVLGGSLFSPSTSSLVGAPVPAPNYCEATSGSVLYVGLNSWIPVEACSKAEIQTDGEYDS